MSKSFKIYTLGCKVNQYDSYDLSRKLQAVGFRLVKKAAKIAIINSCAVTKTAIHKGSRIINKARRENAKAKIILMGCWPEVYKNEIKDFKVDSIWGTGKLDELVKQISNLKFPILKKSNKLEMKSEELLILPNKSRYFIKIQDGCEQFCSYCVIPFTRGKLKSRPENEVIKEVQEAVNRGCKEIVLSGIHLGQYGKDLLKNINLVSLIKKLIKINNLGRIRLSSIEINEISRLLIKLIATSDKLCKHLHIPLQSGSDKILELMRRPYTKKYYIGKINDIRRVIPKIGITTDIMVGFPSETERDFIETYNFINKLQFSRLHIFPYSEHKVTAAARLPNKVDKDQIIYRAKELRALNKTLTKNFKKKFNSEFVELLIEREDDFNYYGKTSEYIEIFCSKRKISNLPKMIKKNLIGEIIKIKGNLCQLKN